VLFGLGWNRARTLSPLVNPATEFWIMTFAVGDRWTYRAPTGFESSRLIIGAILHFENAERVMCFCKQADGTVARGEIPFVPMSETALERTVLAADGTGLLPEAFATAFEAWHEDGRGLSYFTVPFEGDLERMIALQMAQIVGADVGET
jgi:hypothetical protein